MVFNFSTYNLVISADSVFHFLKNKDVKIDSIDKLYTI